MNADQIKISIGSFNVGTQPPGDVHIDDWLHIHRDEPDILVVGLLEADASNLSYVLWSPDVEDLWNRAIESAMASKGDEYRKLTSKQLVGTMILIYVRKSVLPRITNIAMSSVGIGVGGYLANKGAVAVRLDLNGSVSVCFVVSHLSAFEGHEARERRRWDYTEIIRRLRFTIIEGEEEPSDFERGAEPSKEFVRDAEAMLRAQLHHESQRIAERRKSQSSKDEVAIKQFSIMDHDVVFWAGDLNWRLELGIDEVKRLIKEAQFEGMLLKYDQLRSEMQAKACFQEFQEQKIESVKCSVGFPRASLIYTLPCSFAPTYKFDRGTQTYDTSEKKRVPSWTDRILWKHNGGLVQPIHYDSCPSISISDHKPISASFVLKLSK
jgi:phosphatidylinositol-bisphosphatase